MVNEALSHRDRSVTYCVHLLRLSCICKLLIYLTSLLINWLGRYARVVDHTAVKNVAQGVPLGGGSTLHPYCTLCSLREPMDRNRLGQCTALFNRTECERYWEARTKMMEVFFYCYLLWLLLIVTTFIFTLNVFFFSIYSVIVTFYFYWSHRSMIISQCTCH
jgi:hypothetical protein